jgi:triacylglycerol lipase
MVWRLLRAGAKSHTVCSRDRRCLQLRCKSTINGKIQLNDSSHGDSDNQGRAQHGSPSYNPNDDASLSDLGTQIVSDYANLRPTYLAPKYPIVLAHGLMGFDELRLIPGNLIPGIAYWRGIKEAYTEHGIQCITTAVRPTASITERAEMLMEQIASKIPTGASGQSRDVNIIAHSMGGLDARYMISRLCPDPSLFRVRSLTTIATPHRGSSAADMLFRDIGPDLLPQIYRVLDRFHIDHGAFSQLTTTYIQSHFNKTVPNDPLVRYFSYGASATPHIFSIFRISHDLMQEVEGPNDGLVSVKSSKWGEYKGTLMGVTHLDLINWTNRIKRVAGRFGLVQEKFNAVAFYLAVAEELAKEGF